LPAGTEIESDGPLVVGDLEVGDVALRELGQFEGRHGGGVEDPDLGACVVVDADDEKLAVLRGVGELDVPVGLQQDLPGLGCEVVAQQIGELVVFVGREIEARAVGAERLGDVGDIPFVGRQILHRRALPIVEIDVGVVGRAVLDQGQVALIGRDVCELVALVVLEDQLALVVERRVSVDIEESGVPLVRHDDEGARIMGEVEELGLETLARSEIADRAVELLDVDNCCGSPP
jgi:hypothetical protein